MSFPPVSFSAKFEVHICMYQYIDMLKIIPSTKRRMLYTEHSYKELIKNINMYTEVLYYLLCYFKIFIIVFKKNSRGVAVV